MQNNSSYYIENSESKFKNFIKKIFSGSFGCFQALIILAIIMILLYFFVLSPHITDGNSMKPTLCNRDIYFALKRSQYTYGDVISFKYDENNDYVKRVVGLPKDVIIIREGNVYRNGQRLTESYLPAGRKTLTTARGMVKEGIPYTVPDNAYFVLGDNRGNSIDSRVFGAINPNEKLIKGKIIAVAFPFSRMRVFDNNIGFDENRCEK